MDSSTPVGTSKQGAQQQQSQPPMQAVKQAMKGKIWTKLSKGSQLPDKSQLILGDCFQKQGKIMKSKRYFELYPTMIFYYAEKDHNQPKGVTEITFEMCFELLRERVPEKSQEKNDKIKLGKPKGIKFDKSGAFCELFSADEKILFKWRDALRNIMNQRGFHELYKAHKKIGKGNFASVYLAERLEDEKMFAVKAFSKEAAYAQEKGKEALLNEVDLMRALDHPNVMKLHEVFETENSLYFILDLLEGGQLYDKMKQKHRYSSDECKIIIKGLLEGIAHMHSRNIMHRDLKPENVLFKDSNSLNIIIADLGLATRSNIPEYLFVRCGTPGFVAPEVVNIKNLKTTYHPVCDLFSLGLMFHILLIGKSPFDGKTYNDILSQNRACNIKFDGVEYLKLPLQTYDLLKKMLEKDPRLRISAQDALKHPYFEQKAIVKPIVYQPVASLNDSTQDEIKEQMDSKTSSMGSSLLNSPQMMPRHIQQVKNGPLDQDSCINFKMAATPIMYGRGSGYDSPGSPGSPSNNNNNSFQSLDKLRKDAGFSSFNSPEIRNKATSFNVNSSGKKSPDLASSNLKRALMNNMKDYSPQTENIEEVKEEPHSPLKPKDLSKLRNNLKNNI